MKKQNILKLTAMIFLITIVTAGVVSDINKTISLTAEQSKNLKDLGLDNYTTTDYILSIEENERCLTKYNTINTCKKFPTYYNECSLFNETNEECLILEKIYYTEQEMINILDSWEEQRIKQIADVKSERDSRTKEKIREGTTTIQ